MNAKERVVSSAEYSWEEDILIYLHKLVLDVKVREK
jgi:hypothetical protein